MIEVRISEIEDLIAKQEINAAQVFTQMKQLILTDAELNKIKAEAVEHYHSFLLSSILSEYYPAINEVKDEYFNKLEKGELK